MALDRNPTLERDETASLIASDKLEGTPVYGADGKRVGKIDRLMIDKISGKVAYAVMSFGGFLGIGADHYPIPWPLLKYNTDLGGYQVSFTEEQLKGAPKYADNEGWDWSDQARGRRVYEYWGTRYYWGAE
jgi:sporulation protein YlmC with PRC-barrel domain